MVLVVFAGRSGWDEETLREGDGGVVECVLNVKSTSFTFGDLSAQFHRRGRDFRSCAMEGRLVFLMKKRNQLRLQRDLSSAEMTNLVVKAASSASLARMFSMILRLLSFALNP